MTSKHQCSCWKRKTFITNLVVVLKTLNWTWNQTVLGCLNPLFYCLKKILGGLFLCWNYFLWTRAMGGVPFLDYSLTPIEEPISVLLKNIPSNSGQFIGISLPYPSLIFGMEVFHHKNKWKKVFNGSVTKLLRRLQEWYRDQLGTFFEAKALHKNLCKKKLKRKAVWPAKFINFIETTKFKYFNGDFFSSGVL